MSEIEDITFAFFLENSKILVPFQAGVLYR